MDYGCLLFRDLPPTTLPARATVITLHGQNSGLDDLVLLARALGSDVRVVALEAARAIYFGRDVAYHTWYGGALARPEQTSFGDSLAQIERALYRVLDGRRAADERVPFLLGYDQGAVLALAATAFFPDLLAGVIAVGGCLPTIPRFTLPRPDTAGLPVLLVDDPNDGVLPTSREDATADELAARGATITRVSVACARQLGAPVEAALAQWFAGIGCRGSVGIDAPSPVTTSNGT